MSFWNTRSFWVKTVSHKNKIRGQGGNFELRVTFTNFCMLFPRLLSCCFAINFEEILRMVYPCFIRTIVVGLLIQFQQNLAIPARAVFSSSNRFSDFLYRMVLGPQSEFFRGSQFHQILEQRLLFADGVRGVPPTQPKSPEGYIVEDEAAGGHGNGLQGHSSISDHHTALAKELLVRQDLR